MLLSLLLTVCPIVVVAEPVSVVPEPQQVRVWWETSPWAPAGCTPIVGDVNWYVWEVAGPGELELVNECESCLGLTITLDSGALYLVTAISALPAEGVRSSAFFRGAAVQP